MTEKEDLGLRFKIWEPPGWSQDHLQVQTPYPSYPESSSAWAKECGAFILLLTEVDSEPLCGSSSIVISPCDALAAGFLSPKGRGQAPFGCIPWVGRHATCYSTTYQRVQPFGDCPRFEDWRQLRGTLTSQTQRVLGSRTLLVGPQRTGIKRKRYVWLLKRLRNTAPRGPRLFWQLCFCWWSMSVDSKCIFKS